MEFVIAIKALMNKVGLFFQIRNFQLLSLLVSKPHCLQVHQSFSGHFKMLEQ